MQTYMAAMQDLGNRLLPLIAIALNLPTDFFDQYYEKPLMFLRPLHYSAQVSLPEEVCAATTCLELHVKSSARQHCNTVCIFHVCIFQPRYCFAMHYVPALYC